MLLLKLSTATGSFHCSVPLTPQQLRGAIGDDAVHVEFAVNHQQTQLTRDHADDVRDGGLTDLLSFTEHDRAAFGCAIFDQPLVYGVDYVLDVLPNFELGNNPCYADPGVVELIDRGARNEAIDLVKAVLLSLYLCEKTVNFTFVVTRVDRLVGRVDCILQPCQSRDSFSFPHCRVEVAFRLGE